MTAPTAAAEFVNLCAVTANERMKDIRRALSESAHDRWVKGMKSALPVWVNDIRPCSVNATAVGAQLSFVCHCSVTKERPKGKAVQVPVRWAGGAVPPVAAQASILVQTLQSKHGKGICYDKPAPLQPEQQQQILARAAASAKRKQAEVEGLRDQLAEKKATVSASMESELDDLKRYRQNETKANNKRAVPIASCNQIDFDYPKAKKDALEHPEYGVEAAFRYNCKGSSKKAVLLILELIERLNLRSCLAPELEKTILAACHA